MCVVLSKFLFLNKSRWIFVGDVLSMKKGRQVRAIRADVGEVLLCCRGIFR